MSEIVLAGETLRQVSAGTGERGGKQIQFVPEIKYSCLVELHKTELTPCGCSTALQGIL